MMKVLVATSRTQGARATDYNWCVEGELVWIQEPCFRDRHRLEPVCGCGRGFAGLASHRATTTAMVADLDITLEGYTEALRSGLVDGGWPGELADELAESLAEHASGWDEDAVLERDLDYCTERQNADASRRE